MSEQRRTTAKMQILDAVLRLVAREGMAEASLRKVAEESGINIGSVRHYFGSHEALMVAAAEEVGARMEHRLNAAPLGERPRDPAGRRALLEAAAQALVPAAPADRAELIVLTEFLTAARIRPEFRPVAVRMGTDMRQVLRQALESAGVADPEDETERLVALIGGLTFELVYPHGAGPAAHPTTVLRRHIATLVR